VSELPVFLTVLLQSADKRTREIWSPAYDMFVVSFRGSEGES